MSEGPPPTSVAPQTPLLGARRVSARKGSTRTVITVRDHVAITDEKESNTGPTQLEMTRSSPVGCEGVIINRCAEAMKFDDAAVDLEVDGTVDQRGSRGVHGVRPEFQSVRMRLEKPRVVGEARDPPHFRCSLELRRSLASPGSRPRNWRIRNGRRLRRQALPQSRRAPRYPCGRLCAMGGGRHERLRARRALPSCLRPVLVEGCPLPARRGPTRPRARARGGLYSTRPRRSRPLSRTVS